MLQQSELMVLCGASALPPPPPPPPRVPLRLSARQLSASVRHGCAARRQQPAGAMTIELTLRKPLGLVLVELEGAALCVVVDEVVPGACVCCVL